MSINSFIYWILRVSSHLSLYIHTWEFSGSSFFRLSLFLLLFFYGQTRYEHGGVCCAHAPLINKVLLVWQVWHVIIMLEDHEEKCSPHTHSQDVWYYCYPYNGLFHALAACTWVHTTRTCMQSTITHMKKFMCLHHQRHPSSWLEKYPSL